MERTKRGERGCNLRCTKTKRGRTLLINKLAGGSAMEKTASIRTLQLHYQSNWWQTTNKTTRIHRIKIIIKYTVKIKGNTFGFKSLQRHAFNRRGQTYSGQMMYVKKINLADSKNRIQRVRSPAISHKRVKGPFPPTTCPLAVIKSKQQIFKNKQLKTSYAFMAARGCCAVMILVNRQRTDDQTI